MVAVSGRLVDQRGGHGESARGRETAGRPASLRAFYFSAISGCRDASFDVWGDVAAGGLDVAAVLAAAAVRAGARAWVGWRPGWEGRVRRIRISREPMYGAGGGVNAVFVAGQAQLPPRAAAALAGSGQTLLFADATRQDIPEARLLPLSALACRIPSLAYGDRLVLLGMWTWMCGLDADVVRRVLESALAVRGARTASAALRLFELGWREAPWWLPPWPARSGASSLRAPAPATPEGAASGGGHKAGGPAVVMDGAQALAAGLRAAGLDAVGSAVSHPWADAIVREFVAQGGRWRDVYGAQCVVAPGAENRLGATGGASPRVVVRLARLGESGEFGGEAEPVPGVQGPAAAIVLAPATAAECYTFAALAGALAAQYGRDVQLLVDAWLLGAVERVPIGTDAVKRAAADLFGPEGVVWGERPAGAPPAMWSALGIADAPLEALARPVSPAGADEGDVLLLGWGGTRETVEEAARNLCARGCAASALHLRTLSPLPAQLAETVARFRRVVYVGVGGETDAAVWRALRSCLGTSAYLRVAAGPAAASDLGAQLVGQL